eukprot:566355-Prorocentrum_minimum.AAC.1
MIRTSYSSGYRLDLYAADIAGEAAPPGADIERASKCVRGRATPPALGQALIGEWKVLSDLRLPP